MTRGFILGLVVLCSFATAVEAQGSKGEDVLPDWVTREQNVWVEDGVIFARGSAKLASMAMSINASETRARANISTALANNAISGYSTFPEDTEEPTTFNINGVDGILGDITRLNRFIAGDNTVFTLISCAGAVVEQ